MTGAKDLAFQATIVLAPKDRDRADRFRRVLTGSGGSFEFSGVAPGDYEIYAFARMNNDEYLEKQYLEAFRSKSRALTVQPGGDVWVEPELIASR